MIKKGQIGDQIDDHNRGELRYHPEAFSCRDLRENIGSLAPDMILVKTLGIRARSLVATGP
jgi:hypothetical protein